MGRFVKGQIPWNKGKKHPKASENAKKTGFQKGRMPPKYRPVGSERLDKDGYIIIKTADPKTWRRKHIVVYEKHFGKVPNGYCIRFKNGNKHDIRPENMMAIPRGANAILNKSYRALGMSETVINLAHLTHLVNKHESPSTPFNPNRADKPYT